MTYRKPSSIGLVVILALLAPLAGGIADRAVAAPMTPELAARRENHRKQLEQRITPEKRKAAVEALKAERLKVYKAKEAVRQMTPESLK